MQIYELVINGEGPHGNFFANVLHYRVSEDSPDTPFKWATQLIDAWRVINEAPYAALLSDDTVIHSYACRRVRSPGGNTALKQVGVVGTGAGDSLANGIGADLAFISDASTLKSVGHLYTPAVTGAMLSGGVWQAGFIADVDTFFTALPLNITFSACQANLTIYHKKTHTDDLVDNFQLRQKPVLLNKRLRPIE